MIKVFASSNKHKIAEVKEILKDDEIVTSADVGFVGDIDETGSTFLENALIKARTISEFLKEKGLDYPVLADDSGLCVEALNGQPGVYSARYAGSHGDNEANRQKLLAALRDTGNRKAYFQSVIVEYYPDGSYIFGDGRTYGHITERKIGNESFCYDCLFFSDDLKKTFGEATPDEKNQVSHRYRALMALQKNSNSTDTKK